MAIICTQMNRLDLLMEIGALLGSKSIEMKRVIETKILVLSADVNAAFDEVHPQILAASS